MKKAKPAFIMQLVALAGVLAIPHASENWTGDGGKGMSITIYAPEAAGLAENQSHLPALVQSELVSNFSGYSAISVLDWKSLEGIYDKLFSDHYDDEAEARQDFGQLTPTTHFMTGKITKTAAGYHLQMNITKTADKMTAASYSGTFTFWQLDNLTGIRQASLELLQKMGITLTTEAQKELAGAAAVNYVRGQTANAKGITAQRQGNEVAALSYYFQAAAFDPSMMEATSRSSVLNANIASGSMGDNVRNDIEWRKKWVERLAETEQFFDNFNKMESMPYTLFYSDDIKQGKVNYQNETVPLSIETYLYGSDIWTVSIERALQAVYDGLNATGRKDIWELGNWPQRGVTDLNAFERRRNNFSVVFELVNNRNKVIGRQTLQAGGSWGLSWGDRPEVTLSSADRKTLEFQNVNANDITDNLTIRAATVNGTDAETAAINGVLQIRAITPSEVKMYDMFRFSRGTIQGFARHGEDTDLVIPSSIWGEPVTSIGEGAFQNVKLTKITISNSVTYIGEKAFFSTYMPKSITIGANVDMAEKSIAYNESYDNHNQYYRDFKSYYDRSGKKAGKYVRGFVSGSNGWIHEIEAEQRKVEAEQRKVEAEQRKVEAKERMMRTIRFGGNLRGGFYGLYYADNGAGSKLFDMSYANYEEMGKAEESSGGHLALGLMLRIKITDMIALATELNYSFVHYDFCYGNGCRKGTGISDSAFAKVSVSYQTMEVPILLRFGAWEAGLQLGFPVSSEATVSSGKGFPHGNFKDKFSDFRVDRDMSLVFGIGSVFSDTNFGLRFIYPLTKLDRYGTLEAPFLIGLTLSHYLY